MDTIYDNAVAGNTAEVLEFVRNLGKYDKGYSNLPDLALQAIQDYFTAAGRHDKEAEEKYSRPAGLLARAVLEIFTHGKRRRRSGWGA
jgi:hypothetical protein